MIYHPKVDDYVKWKNIEGWIYFSDPEYCTIEIGVKNKSDELVQFHKKTHCLVVCYNSQWKEIEYIKNRRGENV